MKEKLQVKDYITMGIIVAMYFIVFNVVAGALVAMSTKLLSICQGVASMILAPLYMLFIAKVQKNWAILSFGVIITSVMFVMMGFAWPMVFGYIGVVIAEFVARSGNYKSAIKNNISYAFFVYWSVGLGLVYYILGDKLLKAANLTQEQIDVFMTNINTQTLIIGLIAMPILAFVGGFIGRKMLKKHFEKAGIV